MGRIHSRFGGFAVGVAAMALAAGGLADAGGRTGLNSPLRPDLSPAANEQVRSGLLKASLGFVPNTGALDPRVSFWLPGSQASVYLTDAGLTYRLSKPGAPAWVVRQEFVGAAATRPVSLEAARLTSPVTPAQRKPRSRRRSAPI